MVSMTIREVPDDTRDRLAARAERAGQSLQQYMRALLVDAAEQSTTDEWLDEARSRVRGSGVRLSADDILDAIHEGRDGRP